MPALDSVLADLHYRNVSFGVGGTNRGGGDGEFHQLVFSFLLDEPVAL